MAIVFLPSVAHVDAVCREEITYFEESAWGQQESGGWSFRKTGSARDAFEVRDEFLSVVDAREALDFLRHTGQFAPYEGLITWPEFQLWQGFVRLVMDSDQRPQARKHKLFKRGYLPKGADGEGIKLWTEMHVLASSFLHPHSANTEIEFLPLKPAAITQLEAKQLENALRGHKETQARSLDVTGPLTPLLVLRPRCTLHAIAAAVCTERLAGIEWRSCKECSSLFQLGSRKEKLFCDDKACTARRKKRRTRELDLDPTAKAVALATQKPKASGPPSHQR